jgi:hypothetical protein
MSGNDGVRIIAPSRRLLALDANGKGQPACWLSERRYSRTGSGGCGDLSAPARPRREHQKGVINGPSAAWACEHLYLCGRAFFVLCLALLCAENISFLIDARRRAAIRVSAVFSAAQRQCRFWKPSLSSQRIPASRRRRTISTAARHRSNSRFCSDWESSSRVAGWRTILDGIRNPPR